MPVPSPITDEISINVVLALKWILRIRVKRDQILYRYYNTRTNENSRVGFKEHFGFTKYSSDVLQQR